MRFRQWGCNFTKMLPSCVFLALARDGLQNTVALLQLGGNPAHLPLGEWSMAAHLLKSTCGTYINLDDCKLLR